MEWTEEKMKKVQQEIQKTWRRERFIPGTGLSWKGGRGGGYSIMWHEFLEPFGIRVKYCPDGTEPECGEGELLFLDPYGHNWCLIIPKETAERILVLGL